ncbi:MAG: ArsR/SmtB family transcription factor [Hyphomicrobiaceae bacterium]
MRDQEDEIVAAGPLTAEAGLIALRAIGEPTRLRILMLLATGELTVKDLTQVLGQSQPRISRHLKLMHDAGLLTRVQEGSWVYFRLTDNANQAALLRALLDQFDTDDSDFRRDRDRAETIRRERFQRAQVFFANHADQWDELRAMHADETEVETRICELLEITNGDLLVDMGTGTGRVLELLAGRFRRAIGIDTNQQMLAYARARTQGSAFAHVQIRQGDICNLALPDRAAEAVIMHQVLHYLPEPGRAIAEATRILRPDGRLLIVDFAAHTLDRLRDEFAHQRLGFTDEQMNLWLQQNGLSVLSHEELPPARTGASEGLTVSVWLATRGSAGGSAQADEQELEIAR